MEGSPRSLRTVTFVGTYPPTRCGLATFGRSLRDGFTANGIDSDRLPVLAITSGDEPHFPSEVVGTIRMDNSDFIAADTDAAILQHEFGIYGRNDGMAVLDLIEALDVPTLSVLHTVPEHPSPRQRMILEGIAERSIATVVMGQSAHKRLSDHYRMVDSPSIIPHGAWPRPRRRWATRPMILTWGLLGPGKGIEKGIRALPALRSLEPTPIYVIAGQTHPSVLRASGEEYRHSLEELARELGVSDLVRFVNRYLTDAELVRLRQQAWVCLLPYDNHEQVTSGALVEAVAAEVPVVATRFSHAEELLSNGAGILVDETDRGAIPDAISQLLTNRRVQMVARSALRRLQAEHAWPSVAARYEGLLALSSVGAGAA